MKVVKERGKCHASKCECGRDRDVVNEASEASRREGEGTERSAFAEEGCNCSCKYWRNNILG